MALFRLASIALAALHYANGLPQTTEARKAGLWRAMNSQGKDWMGTALTIRDDPKETKIITNDADFNSITPENAMKWAEIHPQRNRYTFADADAVVDYAATNDLQIHCHTLVWHSQLAPWVEDGNFDNATLIEIMKDHITRVAGRYKRSCTRWDVVNEALNEDGTYRESVWYNTIGEAYIPIAFETVAKVAPNAKLFYNDYNLEYGTEKAAGARRIVKLVQRYGARIDGVGLQAHLTSEPTPSSGGGVTPSEQTLTNTLRSFTKLNVDVAYTELDMRMVVPPTDKKKAKQDRAYARVARSCAAVERCVGITLWGVTDKYSWIPGVFEGEGYALLWNKNYQKKSAYRSFLSGLLS